MAVLPTMVREPPKGGTWVMKKCFTCVALVVTLLVPVAGVSAKSTAPTAKIVVAAASAYPALKAAKAKGVFSAAGLDVSLVPMTSSKGAVKAVSAGTVQFAIVDPGVAMYQATAFGQSVKIVSGAEVYKAKSF